MDIIEMWQPPERVDRNQNIPSVSLYNSKFVYLELLCASSTRKFDGIVYLSNLPDMTYIYFIERIPRSKVG